MPQKVTCSGTCGELIYRSTTSQPEPMCRACRSARKPTRERQSPKKICPRCSTEYVPAGTRQIYCTEACRWGRACEVCGKDYIPGRNDQRTCGRACGVALRLRENPPRGRQPKPAKCKVAFANCEDCGQTICRGPSGSRKQCPPCAKKRRSTTWDCRKRVKAEATEATRARIAAWRCVGCGTSEQMHSQWSPYCIPCRTKAGRDGRTHRSRARRFGVAYEPINSVKVYARDGWVCGICGDAIDSTLAWPDQMCASLDHVVPMSLGGPHLHSNVQAAHWLCNTYKGADETVSFKLEAA